jgi:hypothetical protein
MGFLKSLGKIARQAAPFASLIPGVGPIAAAGLGAGGSLLEGGGLKGAIKGGLGGYVGSSGISGLTGGKGIMGVTGAIAKQGGYKAAGVNLLKSKLGMGGGASAADAAPAEIPTDTRYNPDGSIASQIPIPEHGLPAELQPMSGGVPGGAPDSGGWLSTGLSWLKNHPDLALAGGSAILSAKTHADAQKQKDAALAQLQGEYDAKAPLRALGLSQLTQPDPRLAKLPGLFSGSGNPYAVAR